MIEKNRTKKCILVTILLLFALVGIASATTYLGAYDTWNVLRLHMNQTAGHPTYFNDSSTNASGIHMFTATGGVVTQYPAKFLGNASGYFPADGQLTTGESTGSNLYLGTGNFTLHLVYNRTDTGNEFLLNQGGYTAATTGIFIYLTTDIVAGIYSGTTLYGINSGTSPPANASIDLIRTSGVLRLYINGTQVGGDKAANVAVNAPTATFKIGGRDDLYFKGYMDEFALWNGVSIPISELYPQTYEIGQTMPAAPVAISSLSRGTVQVGGYTGFNDTSLNTPTAWCWTFGDGGFSDMANGSHFYTRVGIYNVSSNVSNSGGYNNSYNIIRIINPTASPEPCVPAVIFVVMLIFWFKMRRP